MREQMKPSVKEGNMKITDEVCGMTIDAESAAASAEFQGNTYYFCSDRCRGLFQEDPERYVPPTDQREIPGGRHHRHL
jgi:Cu+-exporting ATPase